MNARPIIGITGASGMPYAARLLHLVAEAEVKPYVIISDASREIIANEIGTAGSTPPRDSQAALKLLADIPCDLYSQDELDSPISSGSFPTSGMVIIPCSMTSLGKIASGIGDNLISRAASVTMKEGRKLVLVPRETPLSAIHLENMLRLSRAGVIILPACPGFYHRPESIDDLIDSIVARVMDHLGIAHKLDVRWGPC